MPPRANRCLLIIPSAILCVAAAAISSAEPYAYFDRVGESAKPLDSFVVPVTYVDTNGPAYRAGLRQKDLIVGIDGMRTRTAGEMALAMSLGAGRRDLTLQIARDGQIIVIDISRTLPARRACFDFSTSNPGLPDTLAGAGIKTDEISGGPAPGTDGAAILAPFPARGHEAVMTVLNGNAAPQARDWIAQLLRVYCLLAREQYDDAEALIKGKALSTRKVHPFLDRLLKFYADTAVRRPDLSDPANLLRYYDVDASFFAVCYPYPAPPVKSGTPFAFDPQFQSAFDKAVSGMPGTGAESAEVSSRYLPGWNAPFTERLLAWIKQETLAGPDNGEIPAGVFEMLGSNSGRARTLAELQSRLESKPDERVLISMALLPLSALEGKPNVFKTAYRTVCDSGTAERAIANSLINSIIAAMPRSYGRAMTEIILELRAELDRSYYRPDLYGQLEKISPAARQRAALGYYVRTGAAGVSGLSTYFASYPHIVVMALREPVTVSDIYQSCAKAVETRDPPDIDKALHYLAVEAAFNPTAGTIRKLVELHELTGAVNMPDRILFVLAHHASGQSRPFRIRQWDEFAADLWHALDGIDNAEYETLYRALQDIDDTAADLGAKLADYCNRYGTPPVCLLLASKARSAGLDDLAETFTCKALDFHDICMTDPTFHTSIYRALRDFVSMPGFEEQAAVFLAHERECAGKYRLDRGFISAAMLDLYRHDIDGAVDNLLFSLEPEKHAKQATGAKAGNRVPRVSADLNFMSDGLIFRSVDGIRSHLLKKILLSGMTDERHIERLRGSLMSGEFERLMRDPAVREIAARVAQVAEALAGPDPVGALNKLVDQYIEQGDNDAVLQALGKLVEKAPTAANYERLIETLRRGHKPIRTAAVYGEFLAKFPDRAPAHLCAYCGILEESGDLDRALSVCGDFCRKYPADHNGHAVTAHLLCSRGEYAQAIESYTRAISRCKDPDIVEILKTRRAIAAGHSGNGAESLQTVLAIMNGNTAPAIQAEAQSAMTTILSLPGVLENQLAEMTEGAKPAIEYRTRESLGEMHMLFDSTLNRARLAVATASSRSEDTQPHHVLSADRAKYQWRPAQNTGWIQLKWNKPARGRYVALVKGTWQSGDDKWTPAILFVNGKASAVLSDGFADAGMAIVDFGRALDLSQLAVYCSGTEPPGLASIEVYEQRAQARLTVKDETEEDVEWLLYPKGFPVRRRGKETESFAGFVESMGLSGIETTVLVTSGRNVFAGTGKGLFVYDRRHGNWREEAVAAKYFGAPVTAISRLGDNALRIGIRIDGSERFFVFEPGKRKWSEQDKGR